MENVSGIDDHKEIVQPKPIKVDKTTSNAPFVRTNHVSTVMLYDVAIVCLWIDGKERLCLAQISNTLLKEFSYNEIHNRRVALGITCVQCTPVQLEILRRAGAMPVSSRRCGMITKREAERLVKSFLEDINPPKLPEDFTFDVKHNCGWGSKGDFYPARYNSSRAKCVKCKYCNMFFSANKFIFHFHRLPESKYSHPDAANFNSWRRHLVLDDSQKRDDLLYAWEDVKAMFNGGSRKRMLPSTFKNIHPSHSFSKLRDSSSESRKVGQFNRSNHNTPLVIEPSVPAFYKPHPSKIPMFNQYPHPSFMHYNAGGSLFGMPQSNNRAACSNLMQRGEGIYHPPYEMIWAKHLNLPHIPQTLLSMSSSTSKSIFNKPSTNGDNFNKPCTPSSIEKGDQDYKKTDEYQITKDIFRPYALGNDNGDAPEPDFKYKRIDIEAHQPDMKIHAEAIVLNDEEEIVYSTDQDYDGFNLKCDVQEQPSQTEELQDESTDSVEMTNVTG